MSENLKLWDSVSRVPKEHLKPFNNGRFSGTAIKPMFFIKTMTEKFGVCGQGWFIDKPEFQLVDAGESKLVYSTVAVWVQGGQRVYGIGGDWAVRNGKGEDEAFKKAYTDALTNALVKLGIGADIHMGLWDGNKYVDSQPEAPANQSLPPIHSNTKTNSRDEFQALCREVNNIQSLADLQRWKTDSENIKRIETLNDDLFENFKISFQDKTRELKEKAAA
jgi:hypothetical protein